jgi:hypothetical protein
MSVKLKTASNGSVTLAPEDTASDVTLTVPAGTSSLVSNTTLRTELNATGSAPIFACRAWVNFDGTGTVVIRESGNVSSITDNGTGDYTVNFTTAMEDANFSVVCANGVMSGLDSKSITSINRNNGNGAEVAPTTTSVRVSSGDTSNGDRDVKYFNLSVFR